MTPPLKWHGGKHYLATKIISLMPTHIHYVEPYFGGGAVLLAKNPEGVSEVVNDINGQLMNFWRTLQCDSGFSQFKRMVEAVPFSQSEFNESVEMGIKEAHGYGHSIHQAVLFFIRCRQSMAGRMESFAPLSRTRTRRGMNEQASAWINAVDGLPEVHARLRRVVILSGEALDVIRQQDGKDTLFYLDPPYLSQTRSTPDVYDYEMSQVQHEDLLRLLCDIKGKFLLSGYPSNLYCDHGDNQGWTRHEFDLPNNSASGKSKERKTECVWTNF